MGWLQFSEAWQLVNKKTGDVNHGLRQFPVGELLSSHQIFSSQCVKGRPTLPSDTHRNIDQRETRLGTGREWEGSSGERCLIQAFILLPKTHSFNEEWRSLARVTRKKQNFQSGSSNTDRGRVLA